uniref:Uncharacterized protein n=1 Tax=Geoglobus ahangari TaxID=113653 RepID=A0A7C4W381_9EURY
MIEKLLEIRRDLKKRYSHWIGILNYSGDTIEFLAYSEEFFNPLKITMSNSEIIKVEKIERVPKQVLLIDSSLSEFEKSERLIKEGKYKEALKSLWGCVEYALTAYGIKVAGCRFVEFSLFEISERFLDPMTVKNIKGVYTITHGDLIPLNELSANMVREAVKRILEKVLSFVGYTEKSEN